MTRNTEDVKSIADAMKASREDLHVGKGQNVTVSPDDDKYAAFYHRVEVRSFKDLQSLHLVPSRLQESTVRAAIAADEAEARKIARDHLLAKYDMTGTAAAVQREPDDRGADRTRLAVRTAIADRYQYDRQFKKTYEYIRRGYNIHLAAVVSSASDAPMHESPLVWQISYLIGKLDRVKVIPGWVFALRDIVIEHNAVLNIAAATTLLHANDIKIHTNGNLRVHGSYLKIRCNSLEGGLA